MNATFCTYSIVAFMYQLCNMASIWNQDTMETLRNNGSRREGTFYCDWHEPTSVACLECNLWPWLETVTVCGAKQTCRSNVTKRNTVLGYFQPKFSAHFSCSCLVSWFVYLTGRVLRFMRMGLPYCTFLHSIVSSSPFWERVSSCDDTELNASCIIVLYSIHWNLYLSN